MSTMVTLSGMRWAVEACVDDRGEYHEGRAWMAERSDVIVVMLREYLNGERSARDAIRRRVLSLFGHDPNAIVENELGETIPPGG